MPVCSCVEMPWLAHPAHLNLPEAGSEKTGCMILHLLENSVFFLKIFISLLVSNSAGTFGLRLRVTQGLSPVKEPVKAAVHNLGKMCYPSAMVFASSWGCRDANAPAASSLLVQHTPDNGLSSGVLGGNGNSFLKRHT